MSLHNTQSAVDAWRIGRDLGRVHPVKLTLSFSQDVTGVMLLRKRVSEPWFTLISAGVKQVEGRLDKGDFARIRIGDVIVWENDDLGFTRTCRTRVEGRMKYDEFRAYLQREHLSRCLPAAGIKTIEQGVRVYRRYYSAEDEKRYGVVALRLSL